MKAVVELIMPMSLPLEYGDGKMDATPPALIRMRVGTPVVRAALTKGLHWRYETHGVSTLRCEVVVNFAPDLKRLPLIASLTAFGCAGN